MSSESAAENHLAGINKLKSRDFSTLWFDLRYLKSWFRPKSSFEIFMLLALPPFQVMIWETFIVCVWIFNATKFLFCALQYIVSNCYYHESWGLYIDLAPNCDLENWKLRSCLADGCLQIVISDHGYLKITAYQTPPKASTDGIF